eukprot:6210805-Pleurochrysis_carterae.AAC.1
MARRGPHLGVEGGDCAHAAAASPASVLPCEGGPREYRTTTRMPQEHGTRAVNRENANVSAAARVCRKAWRIGVPVCCLLYTSDAADDTPCVDL